VFIKNLAAKLRKNLEPVNLFLQPFAMSVVTKSGDSGQTQLRFGRRLSKSHPRLEALGCVDELMAALGLARAQAATDELGRTLIAIQGDLVRLMGELATAREDTPALKPEERIGPEQTARLELWISQLETRCPPRKDWALPGTNTSSAALDLARTVCRRAERRIVALEDQQPLANRDLLAYLNRLGDALWLLAREAEANPPP